MLACKKSVNSIYSFWRSINFTVQRPDWPQSFLATNSKTFFDKLLIFGDLFWRNRWFKNPGIWLVETNLIYISGTSFCSRKYRICAEHSKYYKFSLQNKFSENYLPNFSLKHPFFGLFLSIFSIFGTQNVLPKHPAVTHNMIRVSSTMPNSEKPNDPFQENTRTDNTLEGWTDPVT